MKQLIFFLFLLHFPLWASEEIDSGEITKTVIRELYNPEKFSAQELQEAIDKISKTMEREQEINQKKGTTEKIDSKEIAQTLIQEYRNARQHSQKFLFEEIEIFIEALSEVTRRTEEINQAKGTTLIYREVITLCDEYLEASPDSMFPLLFPALGREYIEKSRLIAEYVEEEITCLVSKLHNFSFEEIKEFTKLIIKNLCFSAKARNLASSLYEGVHVPKVEKLLMDIQTSKDSSDHKKSIAKLFERSTKFSKAMTNISLSHS